MQTTTEMGTNRSGIGAAPEAAEKMMENIDLTKPRGDERELVKVRAQFAAEAEPVGTMPEPKEKGAAAVLMDKLGERLAFERAGVRLYDALIAKCTGNKSSAVPMKELRRHRDEEQMHFALVGAAIQSLGGDPTAQTPSADVTGVEGAGLMQVIADPKTTVAQALHALLVAELTDNAAWEDLIELTQEAGNDGLVKRFQQALENEAEHLTEVRKWHKQATLEQPPT